MDIKVSKNFSAHIGKLIPSYCVIPLITALAYNCAGYWGTKFIAKNFHHYYLGFAFEEHIPFIPETVVFYVGCYIFWAVNFCLSMRPSKEAAYKFAAAFILSETVCFLFYIFLPTTITRPQINVNSFTDWLLNLVYTIDSPDNLFPSIHCLISWLCFLGVRDNEDIPKMYRILSCIIAVLICISTLTVKQHVIIDVFAGVAIAEICYRLCENYLPFKNHYPQLKIS